MAVRFYQIDFLGRLRDVNRAAVFLYTTMCRTLEMGLTSESVEALLTAWVEVLNENFAIV